MKSEATLKFWADNAAYGGATILAGIFNWLYAVLLAHGMGPARYGVIVTLNNVVAVITLPASVVTLASTRRGKPSQRLGFLRLCYGISGIALWGLLALSAIPLGKTLNVAPGLFLLFGLSSWPLIDYAANLGYLARARRYTWLGGLAVTGSGLSVAAVMGAVMARDGVALLGVLQAMVLWMLWGLSAIAVRGLKVEAAPGSRSIVLSSGVGMAQSLMMLTDGVIAKARLRPNQAGLYNGLATVGQTLPFIAGSLALVMLTAMLDRPVQRARWFYSALAIYLSIGVAVELLFWLAPRVVVQWALGDRFVSVGHWLALYGLAMLALGLLIILLAEAIAREWWTTLVLALGGLAVWIGLLVRAPSLAGLVHATAVSLIGLAVLAIGLRMWLIHVEQTT